MIIVEVWEWFTTGANWTGSDGIVYRLSEHLAVTVLSMAIAAAIALPVALTLGHWGRGGLVAVTVSNVGRAVPSLALLVVISQVFHTIGWTPAVFALVALAVPPMVANTFVGIRDVDPDIVEAASGMGFSGRQVLTRVEIPLAAPLIFAGIRTAAIQVVATASLAALVAAGGLGRFIIDGFARQEYQEMYAGAILVAALALATELALGGVQRWFTPRPLRRPMTAGERTKYLRRGERKMRELTHH